MDSWLREIYVLRAWRVHLATGFDFCEKKPCLFWIDRSPSLQSVSYLAISPRAGKGDPDCSKTIFPEDFVYVLTTTRTRHMVKSHRFLFPFSYKFSDLNFSSYVLYNLPVLCHVSHTVSLGYLWLTR